MEFKCCSQNTAEQKNVVSMYAFLRVIADKNRLKILCILRSGPRCVCEIFPKVGVSQKLTSHHLGQLKKIGLLREKRDGNYIYYSLDKKKIKEYRQIFNQIIR